MFLRQLDPSWPPPETAGAWPLERVTLTFAAAVVSYYLVERSGTWESREDLVKPERKRDGPEGEKILP